MLSRAQLQAENALVVPKILTNIDRATSYEEYFMRPPKLQEMA
jgi:hypothetical protein